MWLLGVIMKGTDSLRLVWSVGLLAHASSDRKEAPRLSRLHKMADRESSP